MFIVRVFNVGPAFAKVFTFSGRLFIVRCLAPYHLSCGGVISVLFYRWIVVGYFYYSLFVFLGICIVLSIFLCGSALVFL